jgi:hypothetical protein
MRTLAAISIVLSTTACDGDAGSPPEQKQGAEVSESRSDSSPPLRDIPPAKRQEGQKVHSVKPLPRPKPDEPDAGTGGEDRR